MEYCKQNEMVLKEYRLDFYRLYIKKKEKFDRFEQLYSKEAKDGHKVLFIKRNEIEYRLNSIYRPVEEAICWAKQYKLNDIEKVIMMFGFGNGFFVKSILDKMEEDGVLVIYEPSFSIFLYVMEHYDLMDILKDPKLYLIIEEVNEDECKNVLAKTININNYENNLMVTHPIYDKIYEKELMYFTKKVHSSLKSKQLNFNYYAKLGQLSCENILNNLLYLKSDYILDDLFETTSKDIPVIIVAAGPSLEKNIDELKRAKGHAIIIAVTRALDMLYEHNIEPDFLSIVDPQEILEEFSYGGEAITFPIFCQFSSSHGMLKHHSGIKIFCGDSEFVNLLLEKINKRIKNIYTGGSVATFAFELAIELGFKNIILVGQDLAYAKDGITHAGGIKEVREVDQDYTVEGINGEPVVTRYDWYHFLQWYEQEIERIKDKINIYDATEGGAKIKGTIIKPLSNCIDELCIHNIDCKQILVNVKRGLDVDEKKRLHELLDTALENLNHIYVLSRDLTKYCKKVIQILSDKKELDKNHSMVHKILKGNKKIHKYLVYTLLDDLMKESMVGVYKMSGNSLEDQKNAFQYSKQFYENLMKACDQVKPVLNNVLKEI